MRSMQRRRPLGGIILMAVLAPTVAALTSSAAWAGSQSSNSSSNSSNGVHTRHDTYVDERNGRRRVYERYERTDERRRREDRRRWRDAGDD